MEKAKSQHAIALTVLLLSTAIYCGILVAYANINYPLVGSDYAYFTSHLLDAHLHFKLNGFSIQWFTPTFGGGLPAYPNPQDVQFTLPQLYMLFLNPWWATLAASVTYIIAGLAAAYYFFIRILGFTPFSGVLGAILFNVNGFVFARVVTGHLGYHAFPLLTVLLVAVLHPYWPAIIKGATAAVVFALLFHSGGFFVVLMYGLTLWIAVPILLLIRPDIMPFRKLLPTSGWAVFLTVLLVGSKLYAVISFMHWFPRIEKDHFDTSMFAGFISIIVQLFGTTTIFPIFNAVGFGLTGYIGYSRYLSGTNYGLWEFDTSLSPILVPLFGAGVFLLRSQLSEIRKNFDWRKAGLVAIAISGVWLTTEFRLIEGLFYPQLRNLPILQSLHVNLRFAAVYIFPLAVIGAWVFEIAQREFTEIKKSIVFIVLALISVLSFANYFLIGPEWFYLHYDIRNAIALYDGIEQGNTYPIEEVADTDDSMSTLPLLANTTDLNPYEPIFGYRLEDYRVNLHPGSVWDESDGYFNMTNPASLIYPAENNSYNFERIKISDRQRMDDFVNHRQPKWILPTIQHVLDYLMLAGFFIVPALLLGYFGVRVVKLVKS
jgi:hypothetical protein